MIAMFRRSCIRGEVQAIGGRGYERQIRPGCHEKVGKGKLFCLSFRLSDVKLASLRSISTPMTKPRPFLFLLTAMLLNACAGDPATVRKGDATATGLLRIRDGQTLLSDCDGQVVRLVGELPADLAGHIDQLKKDPNATMWLELDGKEAAIDPASALNLPGRPFTALGVLSMSDSLPCPENWVGAYYDRNSGRVEGKSSGKLAIMPDTMFLLTINDPNASGPITYKGFWEDQGANIYLKSTDIGFLMRKAPPRGLVYKDEATGFTLFFERD
jgi:hypothetical protein